MPRMARIVYPCIPHHIVQRGNNREDVFRSDRDKDLYLVLLKKYSDRYKLRIIAYCLMNNHVHIIAVPMKKDSMAKVIKIGHMSYTRLINDEYNRIGHLWHSRYFSCPLNEAHLFSALKYVEQNPVRAGITDYAWNYRYSSASAHVNGDKSSRILDFDLWCYDRESWKDALSQYLCDPELELIRQYTKSGKPIN